MTLRMLALAAVLMTGAGCGSMVYAPDELAGTRFERSSSGVMTELVSLGRSGSHALGIVAASQVDVVELKPLEDSPWGVEQSYALEATFHGEAPEVVATVHVHDPRGLSIETEVGVQDCRVVGVAHRLKGAGAGKALGYGTMDVAMAEVAAADRADR